MSYGLSSLQKIEKHNDRVQLQTGAEDLPTGQQHLFVLGAHLVSERRKNDRTIDSLLENILDVVNRLVEDRNRDEVLDTSPLEVVTAALVRTATRQAMLRETASVGEPVILETWQDTERLQRQDVILRRVREQRNNLIAELSGIE